MCIYRNVVIAISGVLLASHSIGQTEVRLELPSSIQPGQCRPVNLSSAEMDGQWALYYTYAQRMLNSPALAEIEKNSQARLPIRTNYVQCFTGGGIFAAVCFSKAETKSLNVRTIKLMHAASGVDCLTFTTIVKK